MLVMVWVVKMVGLMTMVALADDGMLNAFALQLLLLLNSLQLSHQLSDESLRRSTAYVWSYKCITCIFQTCIHSKIYSETFSYKVLFLLLIMKICQKQSATMLYWGASPCIDKNMQTQTHMRAHTQVFLRFPKGLPKWVAKWVCNRKWE